MTNETLVERLARAAIIKLHRAGDAETSSERARHIHFALVNIDLIGDPRLAPMIDRLRRMHGNCCDDGELVPMQEQLRSMFLAKEIA